MPQGQTRIKGDATLFEVEHLFIGIKPLGRVYKNRYYNRSRIAEKRFRQIMRYFAMDLSVSDAARLTGISVRSMNAIYSKLRHRLAEECEKQSAPDV